jgi:hypothetical protein
LGSKATQQQSAPSGRQFEDYLSDLTNQIDVSLGTFLYLGLSEGNRIRMKAEM